MTVPNNQCGLICQEDCHILRHCVYLIFLYHQYVFTVNDMKINDMKTERLPRVAISLYAQYTRVGAMHIDCIDGWFHQVIKINIYGNNIEIIINSFSSTYVIIGNIIILGYSFISSIAELLYQREIIISFSRNEFTRFWYRLNVSPFIGPFSRQDSSSYRNCTVCFQLNHGDQRHIDIVKIEYIYIYMHDYNTATCFQCLFWRKIPVVISKIRWLLFLWVQCFIAWRGQAASHHLK